MARKSQLSCHGTVAWTTSKKMTKFWSLDSVVKVMPSVIFPVFDSRYFEILARNGFSVPCTELTVLFFITYFFVFLEICRWLKWPTYRCLLCTKKRRSVLVHKLDIHIYGTTNWMEFRFNIQPNGNTITRTLLLTISFKQKVFWSKRIWNKKWLNKKIEKKAEMTIQQFFDFTFFYWVDLFKIAICGLVTKKHINWIELYWIELSILFQTGVAGRDSSFSNITWNGRVWRKLWKIMLGILLLISNCYHFSFANSLSFFSRFFPFISKFYTKYNESYLQFACDFQ